MIWLRANRWWWLVVIISAGVIGGCGGHKPPGASPYPARVSLNPGGNTSLQLGGVLIFSASAQNSSNGTISASFTYMSSDTSILNVAPNGIACAGHWNATYANCTPGNTGVVLVTASALGATSVPTYVFVHPPIDNIIVKGVLLDGVAVQQPCLSQGQTMTVEAHAFSQGTDITASVGPFTWSANNPNVARITPLVNIAYNFATNQATVAAFTPGITYIYASASGVSSTSFLQPPPGDDLTFFETCPIQNIILEVGHPGSLQNSFAISKGGSETIFATVTDVMGNSSLPNTDGGIVLNTIPLTWTGSQPAVVAAPVSCTLSCNVTTPSAGAGSVTASCTPPSCNIGFPLAPPGSIVPLPVYASPLPKQTTAGIAGLVNGAASATSVLATSLGCASVSPAFCEAAIYSISTSKATAGAGNAVPVPPNSLHFDLGGDKVYMGSDFGAEVVTPAALGTTSGAFATLGTVTGKILAISTSGSLAVFSDTIHVPNQVYVVNTTSSTANVTALNISGASTAAFSPDGLKVFIFGFDSNGNPNLYVYSALQALQVIPLAPGTTVNSIVFSANNAFAYVVEPSLGGGGPAFTVYNTCDNQVFTDTVSGAHDVPLTASPIAFKALPDGVHFVALESGGKIDYISAAITGIPAATLTNPVATLCPMTVGHHVQTISLGQGSIHPIDFFASPDGTLLYVLASDRSSVLVYSFLTGAVTGIELAGNATPVSVDMSADGGTIVVAGSDGQLHQVSTALGGSDQVQVPFPDLPNYLNPFCTFNPASGACTLDVIAVRP
ncbi:MAG: hypothetical protein ACLQBK_15425 [Candidatus Sulfotelmatobacter sp.]